MTNYDPFNAEKNDKQSKRNGRRVKKHKNITTQTGNVSSVNTSATPTNPNVTSTNTNQVNTTKMARNLKNTFGEKEKSKLPLIIAIIVIAVIASNWWEIEYYFKDLMERHYINNIEMVEDYTFDSSDFEHDNYYDPYFELEIGMGESITLTNSDFELVENEYDNYEDELAVGRDVEPGIYTITYTGEPDVDVGSAIRPALRTYDGESKTVYNIPLIDDDEISISSETIDDPFELKLTKQDEYKQYENGDLGLFVYGLSNSNPNLKNSDLGYSYDVTYSYFTEDGEPESYDSYSHDFNLAGAPGTMFEVY